MYRYLKIGVPIIGTLCLGSRAYVNYDNYHNSLHYTEKINENSPWLRTFGMRRGNLLHGFNYEQHRDHSGTKWITYQEKYCIKGKCQTLHTSTILPDSSGYSNPHDYSSASEHGYDSQFRSLSLGSGDIEVWKIGKADDGELVLIKLEIPSSAKREDYIPFRNYSLAEYGKVVSITGINTGKSYDEAKSYRGDYEQYQKLKYKKGETTTSKKYNPQDCVGIQVFKYKDTCFDVSKV